MGFTTSTGAVYSPDARHLVLYSSVVQDEPFRVASVSRLGALCPVSEHPAERAASVSFSADGRQLAVFTHDAELWLYALKTQGSDCGVRLIRKVAHPAFRSKAVPDSAASSPSSGQAAAARSAIRTNGSVYFVGTDRLLFWDGGQEFVALSAPDGRVARSGSFPSLV